ncbi:ferrochelatase [Leptospira sp. 2 VSF19]|uniref:Ferrochelatase n=1 Tax=Leptospira soteropolitanensis TaxID=2950025 RepID=A0AAW5VKJ9_9LEPT|nr:ferrochelatase [Leptospira soteropolitanensis]MCW7494492.1 ferrochelatase [Leptospira soteropolitanensis]MCW7502086.1 ferrochelatase [Leptospira soteropolitanensis]MCW7524338.1 ferrochelatase [Leptospira soteropolitanensis]MCW7528203.1 ferrochelatase [Leptospira soteropolitanensis]MCW7532056.1 ferrochelatase [Leptospira soteropolitanensis]
MSHKPQKTLVLVNLGGPRNTAEIEVFLTDLFTDPFVFDLPLPEFLRLPLARFIAKKRSPKVKKIYESMGFGGGSPLVSETEKQARTIERILNQKTNVTWTVKVAMTCGFPHIRDKEFGKPSTDTIYLPLYPQFSRSTVLSTLNHLEKKFKECPVGSGGYVPSFASDPKFHQISAKFIFDFFTGALKPEDFLHFPTQKTTLDWREMDLVFSAHGVPMRLIRKGDRYMEEIESSVNGITNELRLFGFRGQIHISYQSKVGPAKWTGPSSLEMISSLAKEGKQIAVYPISFVSDHLETLEEIGEQFKDLALELGAKAFIRIPAFGIYPPFIEYLAEKVLAVDKSIHHCFCKEMGGESLSTCRFKYGS